jgi:uncharacterized membrane-anchored protein YjiN (DUF445 family)
MAIRNNIFELSVNIHGNHVVQSCLDIFTREEDKEPIYQTVQKHALKLAKDKQGCCVMQSCLKTGSMRQKMMIVDEVLKHIKELINDQFANYVVSEVVNFKDPQINLYIAQLVALNIAKYANSKYSSGVVENLLLNSDHQCCQIIFDVFMDKSPSVSANKQASQSKKRYALVTF